MGDERKFEATIRAGRGGGAWVEVPFDLEEAYGRRRVKVRATFDGQVYRGSLAYMGGTPMLGVTREIRSAIGKDVGDTVRLTVREDTEPRVVEVPPELDSALVDRPDARAAFDGLSYTHRKEYARWVAEAKRQETRDRRAAKAMDMLEGGDPPP